MQTPHDVETWIGQKSAGSLAAGDLKGCCSPAEFDLLFDLSICCFKNQVDCNRKWGFLLDNLPADCPVTGNLFQLNVLHEYFWCALAINPLVEKRLQ